MLQGELTARKQNDSKLGQDSSRQDQGSRAQSSRDNDDGPTLKQIDDILEIKNQKARKYLTKELSSNFKLG